MKASSLAVWTIAAAALAACTTSGRDRSEPVRALLSADVMVLVSFDANGDLSVTKPELEAGLTREFTRADSNGDGQLQPIEFQNWANTALGGGQIGPFRLDFDRNVDNVITREEFDTEFRGRFSDYDSDENDAISRPEFVRLLGQARPPRPTLVNGRPG